MRRGDIVLVKTHNPYHLFVHNGKRARIETCPSPFVDRTVKKWVYHKGRKVSAEKYIEGLVAKGMYEEFLRVFGEPQTIEEWGAIQPTGPGMAIGYAHTLGLLRLLKTELRTIHFRGREFGHSPIPAINIKDHIPRGIFLVTGLDKIVAGYDAIRQDLAGSKYQHSLDNLAYLLE